MRITLSGPIGSGKTTVCKLLSERTGMSYVVSGYIFRQMAKERGLSLADFGRLAERDPRYDKELDQRMVRLAEEKEDLIMEGRLVAQMLTRNNIPAFRVYLDASLEVRVERVVEREGKDRDLARTELVEREASEAKRYLRYYGIDIRDRGVYDLIIDTGDLRPEQIVDRIVAAAGL
jgi:predicted cytidylate kinase